MEPLRINNAQLETLVKKLENSKYSPKYQLGAQDKVWQMYVKESEGVLKTAYISDHCEMFSTETFRPLGNQSQERTLVEDILKEYKSYASQIDETYTNTFTNTWLPVIAGGVAGIITRHPAGVIAGASIGYVISRIVMSVKRDDIEEKMNAYLDTRNIRIGKNALKHLSD